MKRNPEHASIDLYKRAPLNKERCFYCNDVATCLDHVPPLKHAVNYIGAIDVELLLIPSCRECNSVASAHLDLTKEARKKYLAIKLNERHKKKLQIPRWEGAEIEELKGFLKDKVTEGIREKNKILRRLAFVNDIKQLISNYDFSKSPRIQDGFQELASAGQIFQPKEFLTAIKDLVEQFEHLRNCESLCECGAFT